MKAIYKYCLDPIVEQTIDLPIGAEIISAQVQRGITGENICVWAIVDTKAKKKPFKFYIAGTGHEPPTNKKFIGTVQMMGGSLVLHIFVED